LKRECGCGEFEEIERDCIADKCLPFRRTDELTDLVTDALRRLPPAFVPAADEVIAPFFFDNLSGIGK
jgi:hypothetical protein